MNTKQRRRRRKRAMWTLKQAQKYYKIQDEVKAYNVDDKSFKRKTQGEIEEAAE